MKKILYLFFSLLFINCEKNENDLNNTPLLIIPIDNQERFNFALLSEDGESMFIKFDSLNSIINTALYRNEKENKEILFEFDINGLPSKAFFKDNIILFDNFKSDRFDIAVILPNGELNNFREFKSSENIKPFKSTSNNLKAKSSTVNEAFIWASRITGLVSCSLGVVLAPTGIGLLMASAACVPAYWDLLQLYGNDLSNISEIPMWLSTSLGCTSLNSSCLLGLTSSLTGLLARIENLESQFIDLIRLGEATLNYQNGDVQITLTWDNHADLDLHVVDPFGERIYFLNEQSSSGGQLDVDNIVGFGPENIFWPKGQAPKTENIYSIYVHHYPWYNEPDRPLKSKYVVRVEAFGNTKIFSGELGVDQWASITQFNVNGIIPFTSTNTKNSSFKLKESKIISN